MENNLSYKDVWDFILNNIINGYPSPIERARAVALKKGSPQDILKAYIGVDKIGNGIWDYANQQYVKDGISVLIDCPYEDLPLYINDNYKFPSNVSHEVTTQDIVSWRLRIGK